MTGGAQLEDVLLDPGYHRIMADKLLADPELSRAVAVAETKGVKADLYFCVKTTQ